MSWRCRLLAGCLAGLLPMASGFSQDDAPAGSDGDGIRSSISEKTVPAQYYLYSRHVIESVAEVNRIEWLHGPKLSKHAAALGVQQSGPIEYHVVEADSMYVDVAIPVAVAPTADSDAPAGDEQYKLTEPFRCLSLVFTGSPIAASEQWSVLRSELESRGYVWSGENRELVVNREGFDAQQYVTELQVGIE